MMAHERATSHIVGSLYEFSEAAGKEIVTQFRKNSNSDISCNFNDDYPFTIHASHYDDESLPYLVNSMRNFITVEMNRMPDLLEDEQIIRKRGTHPSLTIASLIATGTQAVKSNGEVPLIEHENIIRRWSPNCESKRLGSKLDIRLLGMIGTLCGCDIEHASDSADVLIKADKEQYIEKGISKLERLNKMMVNEMSFPRIHSFYVLEGEISVDLQLIALKDLNDKRLITTLLRNDSLIKSLRGLCVLILVKRSNIVQVKVSPTASNHGSQLWNDHVYNNSQAQDSIATKTPKEPLEPETRIDKWVSETTNPDVQMDVFRPGSAVVVQQSVDIEVLPKESLSPTPPMKKSSTKRARTARGNPDAFNIAFDKSQDEHDGKEATSQENLVRFSGDQPTGNQSTIRESESHRQPPSIDPPYMPPVIMPSRSLSKTPSMTMTSQHLKPDSSTWNVVVRGSKSGSLIDISVPNEGRAQGRKLKDEAMTVIDNLYDTTKVKTRDLKYTMNQRKAPMQVFAGGDTALVKSFEETIIHLLALALPYTGPIGFAVNIGRLLINQQGGSSEFKRRSFKTSEFSSVLPKGTTTGFEIIFTNMLTARSFEAESIVNILLSQGRRLFQQQPASRKVTYVFSCKAKGGDQIVIEFDETRGFNIQGSEVLLGALDWHFPKRAWDARLQLTSERFLTTPYQKQAQGIADNLKISISEDGQLLELWTKTLDENFHIESITLRRETLHLVTAYPDLILHLIECQDLQVRKTSDSESVYSGSVQSPTIMKRANRLWWEAKISSTNADSILKENLTLELGETATWTPSSIINKGVVRDLFAATKELVTRIDHVGFFNRGKASSGSKATEKLTEDSQDAPASLRRVDPAFW